MELALATAQESVDLSQHAESNFHVAEAAADLAAALLETGQPRAAMEILLESAGGEELVLIAGSPRARCHALLARARSSRRSGTCSCCRAILGRGRAAADGWSCASSASGSTAARGPAPAMGSASIR
jgi:hypothetical protein